MKTLKQAWDFEKKNHIGDYGDSSEYDLECAFKAGWLSAKRNIIQAAQKVNEK